MKTSIRSFPGIAVFLLTVTVMPLQAQGRRAPVKGSQTRAGGGSGSACALLSAEDVTPVLGSPKPAWSTAGHCTWDADKDHRIVVITQRVTGPAVQGTFDYMHDHPTKGFSKGGDQKGMGDKAFSMIGEKGVEFAAMKNLKMVEIQYFTGAPGTPADLEKLRPVALKAIAAY